MGDSKAKDLRRAALKIEEAPGKLEAAFNALNDAGHDKQFDLGRVVIDLKQIHDILTDPEYMPEIKVGGSS